MTWIDERKIADKFITLFADNRVLPSEWRFAIPMLIVQRALPVVINAKNFADGINRNIELYNVIIPDDKLAGDPRSKDYLIY